MKNLFYLALFIVLCLTSCKSEADFSSEDQNGMATTKLDNSDLELLTSVVQKALINSSDFRKQLKTEVLLQRDGDYDMILKKAVNGDVRTDVSGLRSSFSIREVLNDSYCRLNNVKSNLLRSTNETTSGSYIDDLIAKYPLLQISIPVNAENWNADSEVPVITFIPFDKKDMDGKPFVGYKANGDTIMLSGKTPPTFPVIVIGLNEREGEYYNNEPVKNETSAIKKMTIIIVQGGVVVPDPTNLTCTAASTGIALSWAKATTATTSNTQGYFIYRKAAGETTFEPYASTSNLSNTTYIDENVTTGLLYSYYICGYFFNVSLNGYSISSITNAVSMAGISRPFGVTSFTANQFMANTVELRWSTSESEYIPSVDIFKQYITENGAGGYVPFGSFSPNLNECYDNNTSPGQKIIYKASVTVNSQTSNTIYSYIQIPYRNPATPSPVYIKHLSFTDAKIEDWTRGHPEFSIKVLNVNNSKQSYEVQNSIRCDFVQSKSFYSQDFNRLVLNWIPGFWYDMLTFHVYEIDSNADINYTLSAKFNVKFDSAGKITAEAGASASFMIPKERQYMGSGTFGYYEPINTTMEFPNYGFKLTVGQ